MVLAISVFASTAAIAQTYYYKLVKKVENGVTSTSVSGGLFISFTSNACYESDKNGFSVDNGSLKYTSEENGIKNYVGTSYWGNAVFRFNADKSRLNVVVTKNESIYVYERSTAPAGVTTCSLIKEKQNSGGGVIIDPVNPYWADNGGYIADTNQSTFGNDNSVSTNSSNQRQPTTRQCPYCNGKGRIERNSYPAMYGTTDYQVYCNECGRYFNRSTGHSHVSCSHCHGTGQIKSY